MKRHVLMSLFLLLLVVDSKLSRRFKRQVIPSQHIMIHSVDSKVNMDRFINVASMDSRIQLLEKNVNGTFWSSSSKMQFDAYDSFVNASFNSEYFHINIAQCELLFGNSLESLLFMTTNRTSDGHSLLTFALYDNANMTLVEEGIEFQGINGKRIYVRSETWMKPVEKTITLGLSNDTPTGENAVELTIVAPVHLTSVKFVGAELLVKYGPNVVSIDPEFKKVLVYNDHYSYCLDSKAPGSLRVTFGNGLINLISGTSDFDVAISPVDCTVNARYLSKTQFDKGDGPIFISGIPVYETGVTVNSMMLVLQLNNDGMLHADATGSETLMKTSIQNVGLTTGHQEIRITGGVPGLVIESGDARFEITKLSSPMAFTYLPGFSLPEDRFENIGPYSDNSTIEPLIFPDPAHLNYTKLATDCKGNTIDFNITNNVETSTGYHLVTFPTVGVPGETTTNSPTTDNDLITEPTTTMETTNPTNTEHPVANPEETTVTIEIATTEQSSTPSDAVSSTQLPPEESTDIVSSTPIDLTTSQGSVESTIKTSTVEGLSTMDPTWISTTDNTQLTTDSTTIAIETSTTPVAATAEPETSETTVSSELTTEALLTTSSSIETEISTVTNIEASTQETYLTTQESKLTTGIAETTTGSNAEETTVYNLGTTEGNQESTTIIMTTESFPMPNEFTTDDFVIGHWFSTEEVRFETTTEPSGIGITVTLGNVDFATTSSTEDDVPRPGDLNVGQEVTPGISLGSTASPLVSSTLEIGNSEDGIPEPSNLPLTSPPPQEEQMLILKLKVPADVDVNSPQFVKNITSSLRRLVRDVSTELRKRRKRSMTNVTEINTIYSTTNYDDDTSGVPIKVENITKSLNITVVTFALQFDRELNNGEYELQNALHEVNTNDLYRYFAFEPVEKIIIERNLIAASEQKLREVLIAAFSAFGVFLIVFSFYMKKKGILEKIIRKLDRLRCNTLATHPNAFSPN
ncbi:hypothetical protein L5515_019204 [Caenorhabditis briggsae]|uniref:Uncharacterized protein n=1 Tax=Caenorhabditis briggsae TaxID=6238 RepID=A0AAE9FL70_CAEBR|nr:hypothetical protein L5515_019204 [Caenorhabditis briggsae]